MKYPEPEYMNHNYAKYPFWLCAFGCCAPSTWLTYQLTQLWWAAALLCAVLFTAHFMAQVLLAAEFEE